MYRRPGLNTYGLPPPDWGQAGGPRPSGQERIAAVAGHFRPAGRVPTLAFDKAVPLATFTRSVYHDSNLLKPQQTSDLTLIQS
jgi:hypothetical protein